MKKRITILDISNATGISKSTISRVINGHGYVSEETRATVMSAIDELGYKPQRKHKSKHVRDLVMITTGLLTSPIQIIIIEKIIDQLDKNLMKSMVSYNWFDNYKLEEYLIYARDRELAGVIMLGALETSGLINILKSMKCPIVLLNQELRGLDVNVVSMDDYRGGYIATKHLIDYGHKHIGLLMGYENATAANKREEGYRDAMMDAGIKVKETDIYYGDFTLASGTSYAKHIIDTRSKVTGIITCNDLMTIGVTSELARLGFQIPLDFSVVGFDNSFINDVSNTKVTTVNYDFAEVGITAANMILEDIANPFSQKRKITYFPSLLKSESVGSPRVDRIYI